jgi:hypothetical protein
MRTVQTIVIAFILGVAPAAFGDDAGRGYEIRLQRPAHAGDRYEMCAHAVEKQHITEHGPWRPDESADRTLEISLSGHVEVLDANDAGTITKLACTVVKSDYHSPDGSGPYVSPGRVIVAEWKNGRTLFSLKGQDAPPRKYILLEMVLSVGDPVVNMEPFLGTSDRKAIGTSWPINARGAVEDMKRKGTECRVEDLAGSTRVSGLCTLNATECLKVESAFDCKNLQSATAEFHGTKLNGDLHSTITRWLPVDLLEHEVAESATFRLRLVSARPASGTQEQFVTTLASESRVERGYTRPGTEPALPPTSQPSN